MKFTKIAACAVTVALAGGLLAGCSSSEPAADTSNGDTAAGTSNGDTATVTEIQMNYIQPDEVEAQLGNDDYLIVDVRKAADYEAGHIPGAINADMDAAKDGDIESGIENMTAALQEATGSDTGEGKTLVLVCYSGNRYAQAGTNILGALGADMSNVFTLEGGMKAWTGATE